MLKKVITLHCVLYSNKLYCRDFELFLSKPYKPFNTVINNRHTANGRFFFVVACLNRDLLLTQSFVSDSIFRTNSEKLKESTFITSRRDAKAVSGHWRLFEYVGYTQRNFKYFFPR